ncbi:MAG: PDZ domain-containing protein [Oscillatoriales cyanobacterium SM2_2_1]|nr:PDZ domain-containing protein [Oscillatoriales cyanobacterium SM2_2_1]
MGQQMAGWILAGLVALGLWAPLASAGVTDYTVEQHYVGEVWQIVHRSYVDPTFNHQNWFKVRQQYVNRRYQSREETYGAVREMLASLDDPFTRLLDPEQYAAIQTSTSGELTGVGLQIAIDITTGHVLVVSPVEGSPADRAGILPLDRIVEIDHAPTEGMTLDQCAERLRGEAGSEVLIGIEREGQSAPQPLQFLIRRDRIMVNPVSYKISDQDGHKTAYIRLSQFNGNAVTDMAQAIRGLEAQGAERYVLDLRGNPGGLFDAGLAIAKMWLDDGVLVHTADRQGIQESYTADHSALTQDPLIVLTNGGTASSSEILGGALQDNHRALLVGTRTFGKGLIQSLHSLPDGSGVIVTVARYETPAHHDINRRGITPDREVRLPAPLTRAQLGTPEDAQYQAAIALFAETHS